MATPCPPLAGFFVSEPILGRAKDLTMPEPASPARSTDDMMKIARRVSMTHISEPLHLELRRLVEDPLKRVSSEEKEAA